MVYLAEYNIWSVLWKKVYRSKITDVDELKTCVTSRLLMPLSASIALSSKPCMRGTLRAQIMTILNRTVIQTYNSVK